MNNLFKIRFNYPLIKNRKGILYQKDISKRAFNSKMSVGEK